MTGLEKRRELEPKAVSRRWDSLYGHLLVLFNTIHDCSGAVAGVTCAVLTWGEICVK